ncbi:IclR family transcriptional regulator [Paenibacillus sp. IHBB 10380]|uniref:IclR family transcriptional regulator n=1 Tax=Paenibacillus sp. IHBB 10380 TaxID=1566358 RepID=UPI0005CFE1F3|nr:IclR family transcriptional regulator [Paenibacillus sp. IHBB 10380]AJS61295.1 IclR family transcriptional regulator [Paenibacillus sp. IHBB 10380]
MEEGKLTVRSVERALDILLCFTKNVDLGLTEIAGQIGLHKSTVHRLLATLEEKGFVTRDVATEKYRLGMRVWELSVHMSRSDDPAILLLPAMERLRDRLGETVSLYLLEGKERLRIQAVQSNQAIRRVAQVGARLPLFVGASSKVLVAFASLAQQEEILNDPEWSAIYDGDEYMEMLRKIQEKGYATSFEEREPGAAAIAVPIVNSQGVMTAALSLSGPVSRLSSETLEQYAPVLIETAREMGLMIP